MEEKKEIILEKLNNHSLYIEGTINEKYLLKGLYANNSFKILEELLEESGLKKQVWQLDKNEFYALAIKSNRQQFFSIEEYQVMIDRVQKQYKLENRNLKNEYIIPFSIGIGMILPYIFIYLAFSKYGEFGFPFYVALAPFAVLAMIITENQNKTLFKMWYFFNIKDETMESIYKNIKYFEWFIALIIYIFVNSNAINYLFF